MSSASLIRGALLVLVGLALTGCLPTLSQSEEEKEPHFLTGKSRINAMDYRGAIESFEKALEVNPQSAAAHFELAWLLDQKEPDPAAAIYHYQQYLKLQPGAGNAQTARDRIQACKQDIARSMSLGPVTQTMQHEFEQLSEENKRLRAELEQWRAYYSAHQPFTNALYPAATTSSRSSAATNYSQTALAAVSTSNSTTPDRTTLAANSRTHTVKAGETVGLIARMYGVRSDSLLAANPRVDPRRLRIGQALAVPSP